MNWEKYVFLLYQILYSLIALKNFMDFPGGTVDKNLPASAGDTGSIPALGKFHMPQSNQSQAPHYWARAQEPESHS